MRLFQVCGSRTCELEEVCREAQRKTIREVKISTTCFQVSTSENAKILKRRRCAGSMRRPFPVPRIVCPEERVPRKALKALKVSRVGVFPNSSKFGICYDICYREIHRHQTHLATKLSSLFGDNV